MQEALLRLHAAPPASRTRTAFLTTVTTRLAIDVLRSARVRRETYVGSWLPEPLVEDDAPRAVEDEETVSLAFLVAARAPHAGRARGARAARGVRLRRSPRSPRSSSVSEANCRQILSRARRRDRRRPPALRPRPGASGAALAARFLAAAREGDLDGPRRDARARRRARRRRRRQGALDPAPDARRRRRSPARSSAFYGQVERVGRRRSSPARRQRPAGLPHARAATGRLVNVVGDRHRGRRGHARSTRCSTPTSSATSARCRTSGCARRCGQPHRDDACHPHVRRGLRKRRYCSHAQHAVHQLPPRDGSLQPRRRCPRGPPPRGQPGVVS